MSIKIKAKCKEPYDVSILSMLQHYGAPTPFVDFTSNPDVALYFAVNGNDFILGDEVDNFFSIYVVEPGGTPETSRDNDLTNFEDILSDAHNSLDNGIEYANLNGDSELCAAFNNFNRNDLQSLDCLKDFTSVYIKETGEKFLRISHKRIDLQNGLFLYQGRNSVSCLETHFDGWASEKVLDTCERQFLKKIKVYDIHKAVLNDAKEYLAAKGVDKYFLGLGTDDFGKVAFEEYLRELAK